MPSQDTVGLGARQKDSVMELINEAINKLKEEHAKEVQVLNERIARLENSLKKANNAASGGAAQACAPLLFSQVAGKAKPKVSVIEANILNAVATETKAKVERERNIIVIGAVSPGSNGENDAQAVKGVLQAIGCDPSCVQRTHRITTGGAAAPSLCATLANKEHVLTVISNSRKLKSLGGTHASIFIRPDRTLAEQHLFRALLTQKKKANEQLGVLLDKPYRWVIRSDRIRCIDIDQSRTACKSVYASPPAS